MPFANRFIKGLNLADHILEHGGVSSSAFTFHESPNRTDNKQEQSINWEDDDNAIRFTLNQTKPDGSIHFQYGVVTVPIEELEKLNSRPSVNTFIDYERSPITGNNYHGNLTIPRTLAKPTMRLICAGLAIIASDIITT